MTIKFKIYNDVPLKNSPLKEVLCQIRFEPLLQIAQNLPSDFQNKIKEKYPKLVVQQNYGITINQQLPSEFVFDSIDEKSKASLGLNMLAMTTKHYLDWENYKGDIRFVFSKFVETYGQFLSNRLGLRYISEITKEDFKFSTTEELLEVINQDLNCLILNTAWSLPQVILNQIYLKENDYDLNIRCVFEDSSNPKIILDIDCFTTFTPPQLLDENAINKKLDSFHTICYSAFRWCIKEEKINIFDKADN